MKRDQAMITSLDKQLTVQLSRISHSSFGSRRHTLAQLWPPLWTLKETVRTLLWLWWSINLKVTFLENTTWTSSLQTVRFFYDVIRLFIDFLIRGRGIKERCWNFQPVINTVWPVLVKTNFFSLNPLTA